MTQNRKMLIGKFAAATSLLALSAPAFAQDDDAQADGASGNSVIIVTAQKKSQNLQDVPISIAAFDAEALETNRLEGVEDLGKLVPGVYVTPNPADNNGVRINIRGVGTFDPQVGQDSRVALYVDGVYLGKTQGLAFDSPDLERVEVLKGPQGTLYGRNSVAGAINLISAKPSADGFFGKVKAEYGNYNHVKLNGALNMPIGDVGGVRVSGSYKARDGWVENDGPGVDFGGGEQYGFRVAFGADLTPDFRFDIAGDFNKVKNDPLFYQSLPGVAGTVNPGGTFFSAAVGSATGRQDRVTTAFRNERGDLETKGVSATGEWDFADDHRLKVTAAYRETDSSRFVSLVPTVNPLILGAILNSDIIPDMGPGGVPGVQSINSLLAGTQLAFQLAGQPIRADFASEFPNAPVPNEGLFLSAPGGSRSLADHQQYSFEATFSGEFGDGALEYTLGAYYYDEKTGTEVNSAGNTGDVNSYLFVLAGLNPQVNPNGPPIITAALTAQNLEATLTNPNVMQSTKDFLIASFLTPVVGDASGAIPPPLNVAGMPQFGNALTLVDLYRSARQSAANDLRIQSQAFALYGEMTWHITDQLSITGGLRYSDESKDGQGQAKSPFFLDNINLLGEVIAPNAGSFSFSVLNPSVVVEFEPNDDMLFYASFKQSFRSGGFNQGAVGTGAQQGTDFQFGREDINAYEAGFKVDLADNRVRINAAGFYYDFKNQQTTVALNPLIATSRAIVNTDEKLWGFEIDALASITDTISLFASYSFIDGNAGDVTNPLTGAIEIRDELQGTPKNSFRVGASLDQPLSDNVNLFATASYSYKDDQLAIPQNQLRLTNQNIVSARIGVDFKTSTGTEYSIALWGENIFDDKYTIDGLPFETFALRTTVFGQPATYGITAGIKF